MNRLDTSPIPVGLTPSFLSMASAICGHAVRLAMPVGSIILLL